MFLIDQKGARVRPVCRECRKVHGAKDCPRRQDVDWKAVERAGDAAYERVMRLREAQRA